jgi:lipoprotein signal peptidase
MGGMQNRLPSFQFGFYRGFIWAGELAGCAAFTVYQFVQSLPNPLIVTTSKGAHPFSWVLVFAFATFVRWTLPKGETWREVSVYGLESFLIACLPVGATELVWDFSYLFYLVFNLGQVFTFFTQTAMIGMMLSGTAVVVGLLLVRWRFNKNRLILAFIALAAYHAVWLAAGFHLSTDPLYHQVFSVHLVEVGHWMLGSAAFWFAYGFKRKKVLRPVMLAPIAA